MSRRILLIDVGNTRLKWAWYENGRPGPSQALPHHGNPAAVIDAQQWQSLDGVRVCDVTGGPLRDDLHQALVDRCGREPRFAVSEDRRDGLVNGYRQPQLLGVDRWLALLAAWRRVEGAFYMVGAGTALTVDVVDAAGRHLGGTIAPGVWTMRSALLDATRFPLVGVDTHQQRGVEALGHDTRQAVDKGVLNAALGTIERGIRALPGGLGIIHGGDGEALASHLPGEWRVVPDLVLEGLAILESDGAN